MTPKLDEARLRELAEAATQGEWIFELDADGDGDWELSAKTPDLADTGDTDHVADVTSRRDAAFIAAASPATILALIDALSAERERGDRAVGLLQPFGDAADFWEPLFPDAEPMMKPAAFVDRWRKLHGRKAAVPQFTVGDLKDARAFLATQKAEGA